MIRACQKVPNRTRNYKCTDLCETYDTFILFCYFNCMELPRPYGSNVVVVSKQQTRIRIIVFESKEACNNLPFEYIGLLL